MLQTILNLLGKFGNVMDLPGSSVRDLITGNNPFDQWLTPTEDVNRVSGRDVLSQFGLMRPNHETGMSGWLSDPGEGLRDIGGALFEGLLDPTNLLPANWVGKVLKSRKATAAANAAIGGKYGYVNPKVAARPAAEVVSEVASSPMKLLGYTPEPELVYHGGHKRVNVSDTHPYGKPVLDSGKVGEGAQAFGPGHYVSTSNTVPLRYRDLAKQKLARDPQTISDYFGIGKEVPGYSGKDRVLGYDPDTQTVTVVRDGVVRTHGTLPDHRDVNSVLGPSYLNDRTAVYGSTLSEDVNLLDWHSLSADPALKTIPDHPNVGEWEKKVSDLLSQKYDENLDMQNASAWDNIPGSNQELLNFYKEKLDLARSGSTIGELHRILGKHPSEASVDDVAPLIAHGFHGVTNMARGDRGAWNMNIWDQNVLDQMRVREINGEKVPWNLMLPVQQQPTARVMPAPESPLTPTMAQRQIPLSLRSPLAAGFMYNMLTRQRGEL